MPLIHSSSCAHSLMNFLNAHKSHAERFVAICKYDLWDYLEDMKKLRYSKGAGRWKSLFDPQWWILAPPDHMFDQLELPPPKIQDWSSGIRGSAKNIFLTSIILFLYCTCIDEDPSVLKCSWRSVLNEISSHNTWIKIGQTQGGRRYYYYYYY